jgi:hypothetical protein
MAARLTPLLVVLLFAIMSCLFISPTWAQQQKMKGMRGMDHGSMTTRAGPGSEESTARDVRDARVSEFNHRLAGFILFLASMFVLAEEYVEKRWFPITYLWPMCLLVAGIFVLVFSDAEIWPLGPQTPWYALTHSLEDLQHKGFAVILLGQGYIEFERAKGQFKGVLPALFFPVLAIAGTTLLLFHVHGGDMSAPDAAKIMRHIENQHRWFAATGLGIAVTKGLAEIPQRWQQVLKRTWPVLLIILGILLMAYTERVH